MNYYRRYSGDYLRDTARLTLTEHGAYTLLLDYYYTSEQPLPLEHDELYLMVRAMRPDDRRAVDKVLSVYFTKQPDGYHQKRVDHEITVSEKARANGKQGGRPVTGMGTGSEPEAKPLSKTGLQTETITGLVHPPTANHQPPATTPQPPLRQRPSPTGSRLTLNDLPAEWESFCKQEKPSLDPQRTWLVFRDYWQGVAGAKARKADWFKTWCNWVRREESAKANGASGPAWWSSEKGIQAKANELGIVAPKGGSWNDLKALINARLGQ